MPRPGSGSAGLGIAAKRLELLPSGVPHHQVFFPCMNEDSESRVTYAREVHLPMDPPYGGVTWPHQDPFGRPTSDRVALVTDGEQRAALAVVRSLGKQGLRVVVCSSHRRSLAGGSRYCDSEILVADPLTEPEQFLADVRELVHRERVDFLIPITEPALLTILPAQGLLGRAEIPFPDLKTFRRVCDKAEILSAAPSFGIAVPEQRLAVDRAEAVASLDSPPGLAFPLVLKPSRSVGERKGRRGKFGVRYARDPAEFRRRVRDFDDAAFPLLLQQRIEGPGIGVFLLIWDGELLAAFSHRRIREKPPSGGVSVYRESYPMDKGLLTRSLALLNHLRWRGVAMVEYKLDAATGTPYLMEINGRFWGSLQLAIDAGVDFPALLVAACLSQPSERLPSYRAGVRSRWWWGDVDQLLLRLRGRQEELALPPGFPGRGRALLDFFKLWRPGDRNEILQLDDPQPFWRETREWFRTL